jgi:ribosomal protein S18 acetylase RimI-like enzyme
MQTYKFLVQDPETQVSIFTAITFRRARLADLPALEWEGEYRHFRRLYLDTYNRMVSGNAIMWVANNSDGKLIGQMFIQLASSNAELADGTTRAYMFGFRMRESYRNAGIGSSMLEYVETDLFTQGFKILCLNVAKDNLRAIDLYNRCGYEITGPDPGIWSYQDADGIYHSMEEPAWRMEKHLG